MDPDYIICNGNTSYLPSTKQYFSALGSSLTASILIIGVLITFGLFILFFELVVYTHTTAHRGARRHIIWIASVFPVMTSMSLVSLIIPRADNICLSFKMVYMSIGISHFTDLTMVMFGGEDLFVERARGESFNLRLSPLCCCCRCLPNTPVTKYSHSVVAILTDQLPFVQSAYYVIITILLAADNIRLGDVKPTGPLLWLNIIKIISVFAGVYGFKILSHFSRDHLDDFAYWQKSRSINILLLITNFQTMIFNMMLFYGVFPCYPPYLSPAVYKQTIDNGIYLLEMMILGPYTFYQYHDEKFSSPINPFEFYSRSRNNSAKDSDPGTLSTSASITANHSSDSEEEHSINSSGEQQEEVVTAGNRSSRKSRSKYRKTKSEERVEIERERSVNSKNGDSNSSRNSNISGARCKDSGRNSRKVDSMRDSSSSSSSSGGARYKGFNIDKEIEVKYTNSSRGMSYDKYKVNRKVSGINDEYSGSIYKEDSRHKDDKEIDKDKVVLGGSGGGGSEKRNVSAWNDNLRYNVSRNDNTDISNITYTTTTNTNRNSTTNVRSTVKTTTTNNDTTANINEIAPTNNLSTTTYKDTTNTPTTTMNTNKTTMINTTTDV